MKFKAVTQFVARSICGNYTLVSNADDLFTPWVRVGERWEHIDGRGCETAKEAAQVCVIHSNQGAA